MERRTPEDREQLLQQFTLARESGLTFVQAAERIGVAKQTVYQWLSDGKKKPKPTRPAVIIHSENSAKALTNRPGPRPKSNKTVVVLVANTGNIREILESLNI